MIRYFCLVAQGDEGTVPYDYLIALRSTGRRLRAIPIGPIDPYCDAKWSAVAMDFMEPMHHPFVNVVCAPGGLRMGVPMTASAMGSSRLPFEPSSSAAAGPRAAETVYEPKTAIVGLLTVGCQNVAIVPSALSCEEKELAALAKYDRVICSHADDVRILHGEGVASAVHIGPGKAELAAFFDELCGPMPAPVDGANAVEDQTAPTRPVSLPWWHRLAFWRRR
jgi:hypothetical protein